jgi:hypothetical protein
MERDGIEDGWRRVLDSLKGFWGEVLDKSRRGDGLDEMISQDHER